jgi:hypothetical protein
MRSWYDQDMRLSLRSSTDVSCILISFIMRYTPVIECDELFILVQFSHMDAGISMVTLCVPREVSQILFPSKRYRRYSSDDLAGPRRLLTLCGLGNVRTEALLPFTRHRRWCTTSLHSLLRSESIDAREPR